MSLTVCIVVRDPEPGVESRSHTCWGDRAKAAAFIAEVCARYRVAPAAVAPDLEGLHEAAPARTSGGAALRLYVISGRAAAAEAAFRSAAKAWAVAGERVEADRLPTTIKDGLDGVTRDGGR